MVMDHIVLFKLIVALVLYLFLPLTALTYYFSRRQRRIIEVKRALTLLKIDPGYGKVYAAESFSYYLLGVGYASLLSLLGLALVFFSKEIGLVNSEFPTVSLAGATFPENGSRLVFAMAFLGAYIWGLMYIFRRYALNDLFPGVYYGFGMRLILASVISFVIYNGYTALTGDGDSSRGITANIWPAIAFFIGAFPQRGVLWLTDHISFLSPDKDPSVRNAPLDMIEGIETHDVLRLDELGIDTCYDLANADFVPLFLKTPYSARQLMDWILQAKMCVSFGDAVKDLRKNGIRKITDLEHLTDADLERLPAETSVTKHALESARNAVIKDMEIKRLREAGLLLGTYWPHHDTAPPPEK